MLWVILWCLFGVVGGSLATYYDFKRNGTLTVADVFYTIVCGCLGGIFIFIAALEHTGGFIIYKKK